MLNVKSISLFKKQKYLKELSEDDFRDLAVRPLFLRLGFKDGRDLCGPTEAGKDAIFWQTDLLKSIDYVAVQTKKGNLNLASKATANLVAAVTQLNTAMAVEIIVQNSKQKQRPNKVILCASGKINEQAKEYLLREVKNPNIQFYDTDDLIPLIDENLPELWLNIDADLLPYVKAIKRLITGEGNIELANNTPASQLLGPNSATDEGFISLNLHRTTLKPKNIKGKVVNEPYFEELPLTNITEKPHKRIMLVGDAGSGKSTSLKRIAYICAVKMLASEKDIKIPILLTSRDIFSKNPSNFVDYCANATKEFSNSQKAAFTQKDLASGNIIILIDSLDELPSDFARNNVLNHLENFHKIYPKIQIIITSRPYKFISSMPQLKAYAEYKISPISWRQAEKLITSVKKGDPIPSSQSKEMLRKLEKIHGIELNPLLVTVFAASTDISKQDIPANITELFKKFTELMLGRWDENKGFNLQYQATLKDFCITCLAYKMHTDRVTIMDYSEAVSLVTKMLVDRGYEIDSKKILDEIFSRSGLFRNNENTIEFKHHLLQEFFAGRAIENTDDVKRYINDEWWKTAIVFYFGDNPKRIDFLKELQKSVPVNDYRALFISATTIGLALQACYLSPAADKLEVWKWVNISLSQTKSKYLLEIDPENKLPQLGYLQYYFQGRDSVALSHLKAHTAELLEWASSQSSIINDTHAEYYNFWLIVGLIESGELSAAYTIVKSTNISDPRLLMCIHLGCYLTAEIRPVTDAEKAIAKDICFYLNKKVDGCRHQLVKEMGTMLLEYKNGTVVESSNEADKPFV